MRAQVIHRYGEADALAPAEVPRPVAGEGELLVEVRATSVNPVDWKIRRGDVWPLSGRSFPKVLGADVAGTVAEVGAGVTGFERGEHVFGMVSALRGGAYAEYAAVPARGMAPMPPTLSFEEAAAVPLAALTALQGLRDRGGLRGGQRVVINGATGGVGHFAVQLARAFEATSVAGVCSRPHAELARRLGCSAVLDYAAGRVVERLRRGAAGEDVNLFFDAAGNRSFWEVAGLLAARGRYVTTLPRPSNLLFALLTLPLPKKAKIVRVVSRRRDLAHLARLIDDGRLAPVVDRVYPLAEIREAHRHSQTGHPGGKIVLRVEGD